MKTGMIVVVDDEQVVTSALKMLFRGEGFTNGKFFNNPLEALEFLKNNEPDVIVSDVKMPEMTGVEFLQERKKLGIDIPVVILSSIATKGAAVTMQCLELGASDFITKPGGSITADLSSITGTILEKAASYGGRYARNNGKEVYPTEFFLQQAKLK